MAVPFVYHPIYSALALPKRHRYPIRKYLELKRWADAQGAKQSQWFTPTAVDWSALEAVHSPTYLSHLKNNSMEPKTWRRIGFPWSEQLLLRTRTSTAGTIETAKLALKHGCAIHFSGGYHHAHADWGSGFCLVNDIAMAASTILQKAPNTNILIIDTDVHQGDGTATIFADNSQVTTCSFHGEKNFPFTKSASDIDIELPKGTTDELYLATIERTLLPLVNGDTMPNGCKPDVILYDAGVDIYRQDELGHLAVSLNGIYQRDSLIMQLAKQQNIPIATVIGGGYQRNLPRLVKAHAQLLRATYEVWK